MWKHVFFTALALHAADVGKATFIMGEVTQKNPQGARPVRVNQKIRQGSVITTGHESILEITYEQGTVVRIGENSEITIDGTEWAANVKVQSGKVWANVKKMANSDFRVSTPVATAAVRGTVFRVESGADQNATVALYSGSLDVGPGDTTKVREVKANTGGWGPPTQIAGPYEVSMDTWIKLKPGTQIHVKKDGKYATSDINPTAEGNDAWYLFNQQRDLDLNR